MDTVEFEVGDIIQFNEKALARFKNYIPDETATIIKIKTLPTGIIFIHLSNPLRKHPRCTIGSNWIELTTQITFEL